MQKCFADCNLRSSALLFGSGNYSVILERCSRYSQRNLSSLLFCVLLKEITYVGLFSVYNSVPVDGEHNSSWSYSDVRSHGKFQAAFRNESPACLLSPVLTMVYTRSSLARKCFLYRFPTLSAPTVRTDRLPWKVIYLRQQRKCLQKSQIAPKKTYRENNIRNHDESEIELPCYSDE